ncbi:putative disease resistance protein RGA1 [Camellia sinensis]|uniref:putative disease resistance protein RGA1 n=1 Tax=Camellia sinensis TaxID=4442 RepID=UPI001035B308|nr:putative disease resistance protein RGA1 [Camellia sinensis]
MEALLLATTSDTNNFSAIGIVGMRGSGKTTLSQIMFHSSRVQESFSPMLWVELPQYPNLRSVVLAILECMASDFSLSVNTCDLDDHLHNMHLYLFNKKYLIVLDNMWPASSDDLDFNKKYITPLWNGLPL